MHLSSTASPKDTREDFACRPILDASLDSNFSSVRKRSKTMLILHYSPQSSPALRFFKFHFGTILYCGSTVRNTDAASPGTSITASHSSCLLKFFLGNLLASVDCKPQRDGRAAKSSVAVGGGILVVHDGGEERGLVVHEVNNTVEFKGILKTTKINIPKVMIEFLLEYIRK